MIKFSDSLKNLNKNKILKQRNELNNNKEKNNDIEIIKNILQKRIKETEKQKNELKSLIFKNCIKENELKNFNKIKEDNKILKERILNLKNLFKELNTSYENQNEKLEKLKKERFDLENENLKLIEYVKNIILNAEKNNNLENNKDILFDYSNNNIVNFEEKNENNINMETNNFDSLEMMKKLSKF